MDPEERKNKAFVAVEFSAVPTDCETLLDPIFNQLYELLPEISHSSSTLARTFLIEIWSNVIEIDGNLWRSTTENRLKSHTW